MINDRAGGGAESSVTGQPGEERRHTQNARPEFCRVLCRPFAAVHKSLSSIPQLNSVHPQRRSLPSHSSRLFVLPPHIPSLHTGSGGGRARGGFVSVDQVPHASHKTRQSPPQRRRFFNLQCVPSCQERKLDYTVRTYSTCTVQYMPCLREHARFFRLVWTEGGPGVMSVSGIYRGCPMFMHACA